MLKIIFLMLLTFIIILLVGSCESGEQKTKIDPARGKKLPYYEGNYKENKNEHMDTESSK